MSNRTFQVQKALLAEINRYENAVPHRDASPDWERLHLASCGRLGYLLAEERGVNPELAAIACSCHDYGRIITGRQEGHAEWGYQPVKEFLEKLGLFSSDEVEQIAIAVKNHSKKGEIHQPLDEVVKDADVLDFHQYGLELPRQDQRNRLQSLAKYTK
jgi:uncharacterized protein